MPDARSDEVAALRHVAYAAVALLDGTADRTSLRDALRAWQQSAKALARQAFRNGKQVVGGRGGSALPPAQSPKSRTATKAETVQKPTERSEVSTPGQPRTTWLSQYCQAYRDVYCEPAPPLAIRRMAKMFKELEVTSPREEVVRRFRHYCAATPSRFYSVEHFATTFPGWKDPVTSERTRHDPLEPLPGESGDAYLVRVTRG